MSDSDFELDDGIDGRPAAGDSLIRHGDVLVVRGRVRKVETGELRLLIGAEPEDSVPLSSIYTPFKVQHLLRTGDTVEVNGEGRGMIRAALDDFGSPFDETLADLPTNYLVSFTHDKDGKPRTKPHTKVVYPNQCRLVARNA